MTHEHATNTDAPRCAIESGPRLTVGETARRLGPASLLALGAAVLPPLGSIILIANIDEAGAWLRGHGVQGWLMYVALFAICAGVALLPTYASAILGGWAFGFAYGLPAALLGFLGGASIGYAVARPLSAERVNRLIDEKPRWRVVRDALMRSGTGKALFIVTLLRLPPNSPFALTNLVLASVRTPLWVYLLGTLFGMLPRTALVLYVASTWRDQLLADAAQQRPWWYLAIGIAASLVVLGIIGALAKKALERATRPHETAPGES